MNISELNRCLLKIEQFKDPLKEKLYALSILTEALKDIDLKPILIGGTALEFYSLGGYATKDVDIALPHSSLEQ